MLFNLFREARTKKIGAPAEWRKNHRVYDVFTFFDELDILEIRLNILNDYVDYFVIIEATETFSGLKKPLYYQENKGRFEKFQDKIIHFVIDNTPADRADLERRLKEAGLSPLDQEIIHNTLTTDNVPPGQNHWLKEFYQKESIKQALIGLEEEDICFVSDVDEIWNPQASFDFSQTSIFKLRQLVYVYFLNNRSSEKWAGTLLTQYSNIRRACLNHLRTPSKTKYVFIPHGGWHFTFQGGIQEIKKKLESYGHQEFNNDPIKESLSQNISQNKDFIGRKFRFWVDETDLPGYLKDNREKYNKLFK